MPEPAIVRYGRSHIKEYSVKEYRDELIRTFREGEADSIILDSSTRGQKFLSACVAWGIDHGWLYNDRNQDDGQSTVSSFRLTRTGKRKILSQP
jgi:hypothetical protein